MPYVDRNQAGNIVGVYANPQREDHEFVETAELWTAQPSKVERIAEKLQAAGFASKGFLYYFIDNAKAVVSLKLGVTDQQAHELGYSSNPMYKQMVDLADEIAAIEQEP